MGTNIFADSVLETSWAQRGRRSWTTLTSFGLQTAIIGLLLLLPLIKTVGLPSASRTVSTPISMGRPAPPSTTPPHIGTNPPAPTNSTVARYVAPGRIPQTISTTADNTSSEPNSGEPCTGACNGIALVPGTGQGPGIPFALGEGRNILPSLQHPTLHEFRTSKMLEGSLIRKVQPSYPPLAKTARIQGPVVLFAVISRSGTIDNLRVLSGHPMLVEAAIAAVKQWQYRPYILNQEPIEVETQITVNFVLGSD